MLADSSTPAQEQSAEVEQPGLSRLREAVANAAQDGLPSRRALLKDALAGLNSAISSVPDGLAAGILVGVNPVYGLYASIAGPIAGGVFASTQLMLVVTTSASALAAQQALAGLTGEARDRSLFALVLLIGVFQILFGLLRLGKLTRFVSYSVMTGFLAGIAVLTALSQLPTITGYEPGEGHRLVRAVEVLTHLGQSDIQTLALAVFTLVLAIALPRTPVGNFGTFGAIIVPSLVALILGWDRVQTVQDMGEIPRGLPALYWPSLSDFNPGLIGSALAIAAIIIVQGAGVSQSVPNPDGTPRSDSRDIFATGMANLAAGFFRGLPVGGSLGATALNVISGARSRWAAIFAGIWLGAVVLLVPGGVAFVAMPALGALLIYASLSAIKPQEIESIWDSGRSARVASLATFIAALALPIEAAVGLGVLLSASLYLNESSADVTLVEIVQHPDGKIEERKRPTRLQSNKVTVLDEYGHLFYASARKLERLLPDSDGTQNPVVILRLRGRTAVGATLIDVLADYAARLQKVNGRLYLTGIGEEAYDLLMRADKLRLSGPVGVYEATPIIGQSTQKAIEDAKAWLVRQNQPPAP